jgi:hypothetical protein
MVSSWTATAYQISDLARREAEILRTGPLVRRSANVSRTGQPALAVSRLLPRNSGKYHIPITELPLPAIPAKIEGHSGCRLPINLRSFLAEQLGCHAEADDQTILGLAERADQPTLNKLARAIRRYSTARAREAWMECRVPVTKFVEARQRRSAAVLCLRCVRVDFAGATLHQHHGSGCVPISLTGVDRDELSAGLIPQNIQRLVEEFRALRAAFGLPHFDLDCYLRGDHLTLMWRPLP